MLSDKNSDQTIYSFTFTNKCIYLYLYVLICMCVCVYIYIYIYMCVCVYIYIYIIYHNVLTRVIFSGKSMDSFFFICAYVLSWPKNSFGAFHNI